VRWIGVLAVEGAPTEDGRLILPEAMTWDIPAEGLSLLDGPLGANPGVVGTITSVCRYGPLVVGQGWIEAKPSVTGIAITLDRAILDHEYPAPAPDSTWEQLVAWNPGRMTVATGVLVGAVLCVRPSWPAARLTVLREEP
jgi:hypothetical protein